MARSLALALYLLLASRGDAGAADRAERPDAVLVWLHATSPDGLAALAQIARRMARDRQGLRFMATCQGLQSVDVTGFPRLTLTDAAPPDRRPAVAGFLAHWRPDLMILTGGTLPPALISETAAQGVPMFLTDLALTAQALTGWPWQRGMARALLSRFARVMVRDADTAERVMQVSAGGVTVDVAGPIEESPDPLTCNEAERDSLATLLRARPVWTALAVPEAEEDTVIAAQEHAMRLAHRMLLILVPADPARIPDIEAQMNRKGWTVALRSREEEPDPQVQVLIVDGTGELGLWYRLAPATYMGGTLSGLGGRSPWEPAALGSAVICGPSGGAHAAAYARLGAGRALRLIRSPAALADAVADLIAPDRAAQLAHNAWMASSGGAEVTDRVAEAVLAALDAQPQRQSAA